MSDEPLSRSRPKRKSAAATLLEEVREIEREREGLSKEVERLEADAAAMDEELCVLEDERDGLFGALASDLTRLYLHHEYEKEPAS